jgi:uncharacterized protein (DUF4415 family)
MSKHKIPRPVTEAEEVAIRQAAATDPDAHELTDAELAEFRPASEVLPAILGKANADALMKRRGRPALAVDERKVSMSMRYDRDLIEVFKATGEGWQTRMNDALRDWAKAHGMFRGEKPA